MEPENLIVGETYKLELLCIHNKHSVIVFETPTGDHIPLRNSDLECVSPANGKKNAETAPKYDQNRLFRKGDKVEHHPRNGRRGASDIPNGKTLTVTADEVLYDWIYLTDGDNDYSCDPAYLELVTPVEELEPYFVMELKGAYGVYNTRFQPETEACHFYTDMHPHAKEAAEAERDRLNAEWRKELQ